MNTIKTTTYDNFKCIASDCPITCCKGWSIRADKEIFQKWKAAEDTKYICDHVSYKREDQEEIYCMKLDYSKQCLLLDEKGLCNIVKNHGDEYLCKTCAEFPRKKNTINDNIEYSLSGGCPAVIELINKDVDMVNISDFEGDSDDSYPMEYRVRNHVIELMQNKEYSLCEKIWISFSFLNECTLCEYEDDVYDCIDTYKDKETLIDLATEYRKTKCNRLEAFEEVCQTFYDVTEFYKEEDLYRPYLFELAEYVSEIFPEDEVILDELEIKLFEWNKYTMEFKNYDSLFEKILVSEIFADCVSEDIFCLIEFFQAIVLEYIMVRLALFLKKSRYDVQITDADIRDYTSLFIRAIGHNTEGMSEYWEESFDDSILERDYFYMILQ